MATRVAMNEGRACTIFKTVLVICRLVYAIGVFSIFNVNKLHFDKDSVIILILTGCESSISCVFLLAGVYSPAIACGTVGIIFFSIFTTVHSIPTDNETKEIMCAIYVTYMIMNLVPAIVLAIREAPSIEDDEDDLQTAIARSTRTMPQTREATQNEVCCICHDNVIKGESIFDIVCKHEMHKECLEKWLKSRPDTPCPYCLSAIESDVTPP
jgi:hypothetical protein